MNTTQRVTGNVDERNAVIGLLTPGGLEQKRVERVMLNAAIELQNGYAGALILNVPRTASRGPNDTDHQWAVTFAFVWLREVGKHGKTLADVLAAVRSSL